MDLQLVIAGGLFSLGGVLLGGLLTPLTQLALERIRERRAAHRAKLLIAAELLHAQLALRTIADYGKWPPIEDLDGFLPTSAWRENRASIVGTVSEDLLRRLVVTYSLLEHDRARFAAANRIPATTLLTAEMAEALKKTSFDLGDLRRELGLGGGWLEEIEEKFKRGP
jgi:hypothetical protein